MQDKSYKRISLTSKLTYPLKAILVEQKSRVFGGNNCTFLSLKINKCYNVKNKNVTLSVSSLVRIVFRREISLRFLVLLLLHFLCMFPYRCLVENDPLISILIFSFRVNAFFKITGRPS